MSFDIDRVITVMRETSDVAQQAVGEIRRLRSENEDLRARLGEPKAEDAVTQILDHLGSVNATLAAALAPAPAVGAGSAG